MSEIHWNRVTWYSKLLAVIFFIGILPMWTFYVGTQYEKTALVLEDTYSELPAASHTATNTNYIKTPAPKVVTSGVQGTVTIGPTCPVTRPDDPACADKPYQTLLVITTTKGKVITTTQSDKDGHYEALLPAGTYTIRAQSSAIMPRLQPINFLVKENMLTTLNFSFDSGIR